MAAQSKYPHSGHSGVGADQSPSFCNLTPTQTARIAQQFSQSLIACVAGKNIYPRHLALRLRRNLHLAGDLTVSELGLGFFILNFSDKSDYHKALENRPWSIPHLCIHVFPWIPNFKPSEALIPFIDVWIRLPELSIEYYDGEVFERIAETIGGVLMKIDPVTLKRQKCMYARICIRINLCNPLDLCILIDGNRQEIVYEGLDLLCPVCRLVDDCLSSPLHPTGPSSKNPSIPSESSSPMTMRAPELNQTNLIQSVLLAPSVVEVEEQSMAEKPSNPAMLVVHNNGQQPSSLAAKSFPPLQPCSALEAGLKFYSSAIQQLTTEKEILNTPAEGVGVDSCPTVYTIDSTTITSLAIGLSEVPATTTTRTNQNQFAINFVPTLRSGNEDVYNLETVSKKMLCWNFPRTDNAKLTRALKDLIQLHEPSVMLIFGTKISGADADQVVRELAFDGSYCRNPDGYNGGVWLLLSRQDVQIEVSSYSPQQVSASVHFHSKTSKAVVGHLNADIGTSSEPWGQTFRYARESKRSIGHNFLISKQ